MFGRRGNRNGIETCGNGKEWKSWKPFSHTSMLEWLVFPEPWIFGCDFQFVWDWKKNARRYSCIKVTIKTKYILSAIATLEKVSCTPLLKLQFIHKLTASDTSKTAKKITKRWYYSAAHWHLGDVLWVISPFCDFCSFRFIVLLAVNLCINCIFYIYICYSRWDRHTYV